MTQVGLDVGSRTIKMVVMREGEVVTTRKMENSFNTLEDCRKILDGVDYDMMVATGYGRHLVAEHFENVRVISEIKAFALGVRRLYPECRNILDIGGQDTKSISLGADGSLSKFEMNDKCAAGTGRFLEVMAMALAYSLGEFGERALESTKVEKINSMCTVFAESEVVSLLARGSRREDVACAILQSVVSRAVLLIKRVGLVGDSIVFVGGVAQNCGVRELLSRALSIEVITPDDPQIIGALGAALA
ncbi:MAG: acyl-CoA dehydratase activase [Rikenellaceae bacterium]